MSKPDAKKAAVQQGKRQERERRQQRLRRERRHLPVSKPVALSFPMGSRMGAALSFYKWYGEKLVSVFKLHSGLNSSIKDGDRN